MSPNFLLFGILGYIIRLISSYSTIKVLIKRSIDPQNNQFINTFKEELTKAIEDRDTIVSCYMFDQNAAAAVTYQKLYIKKNGVIASLEFNEISRIQILDSKMKNTKNLSAATIFRIYLKPDIPAYELESYTFGFKRFVNALCKCSGITLTGKNTCMNDNDKYILDFKNAIQESLYNEERIIDAFLYGSNKAIALTSERIIFDNQEYKNEVFKLYFDKIISVKATAILRNKAGDLVLTTVQDPKKAQKLIIRTENDEYEFQAYYGDISLFIFLLCKHSGKKLE